jgi:biopolymer transport protein ExbD
MGDGQPVSGINVTPMVDIMLVLLVIFMVTTSTLSQLDGLDVNRPDAATGAPIEASADREILLTCRPDGTVAVDGQLVADDAAIRTAIEAKRARNPELSGIIACDEDASVRALVRLLDLLRAAGIHRYAIATESPSGQPG